MVGRSRARGTAERCALPRTDLTVKRFLTDLVDRTSPARLRSFSADTRIARMYWPERVRWSDDPQMEGWYADNFSPFTSLTDAVELARHIDDSARLTIEISGTDSVRATLFHRSLCAGVTAVDDWAEYAVVRAILLGRLVSAGAMYGYVIGMGLNPIPRQSPDGPILPGAERPVVGPEDILAHQTYGDTLRGGLGRGSGLEEIFD